MNQLTVFAIVFIILFQPVLLNAQSYQNADLPDALTFFNGRKVTSKADFQKRKAEIKDLWCRYYIGHYPKEIPALLSAELIKQTELSGSVRKRIKLTFDTPNKKSFEIELWIPVASGPFPLLLTQPRYYQIPWAGEALKRGYIVCLYPGLDTNHSEEDYPNYQNVWREFRDEYPDASWSSSLGIQAWLASRTLDYLLDPKFKLDIDTTAVGIIGHSRYGKQSIYAAAFDDRIKCVVARSSGTPTACPYRFASRHTFMESVSDEDCPKDWVLPELSDFLGRENELPVSGNDLLATIAPRYLMIHTAYNDGGDPTFGVERSYLNAKKAYAFSGFPDNIRLIYRKGNHNPITDEHVKTNLDFFDMAFHRGCVTTKDFPEVLLHQFDWNLWLKKQDKKDLHISPNASLEEKIDWMLGHQPADIGGEGKYQIKTGSDIGVPDASRDRWNPGGLKRVTFSFSGNMNGNIYFDPANKKPKATVIWLHPWNYSHGSNESYGVQGTTIYWRLAQEGYLVVTYDQFGFGDHLLDAVGFYEKYPHWSKLGRAVYDVQKVVDFLLDGKGITSEAIPETDPSKIFICGYSYGAMVGLYATALDKRIAGVASFSGFTPMRTDSNTKPSGGIQQYYQWHAILPKLGIYNGKEKKIPYDYDDLIKMIAPRNCLIYAPVRDRFTDADDVANCIEKARKAWPNSVNFEFKAPDDICRFQKDQQDVVVDWLNRINK